MFHFHYTGTMPANKEVATRVASADGNSNPSSSIQHSIDSTDKHVYTQAVYN